MAESPAEDEHEHEELQNAGGARDKGAPKAEAPIARTWKLVDEMPVRAKSPGRGLWSGAGARTLSGSEFAEAGERKPLLGLAIGAGDTGEDDLDGLDEAERALDTSAWR